MLAYLLTLSFVIMMSWLIQSNKGKSITKWLLAILIVGMSLFIGFRYWVGTDYGSYYRGYYLYSRLSWKELIGIDDPALRIIAKLSTYIVDSPITMFTIAAFIFCTLFTLSIYEYSDNFLFAMILFICCGTFLEAFNGVRQATAVSIIFFGLRYIKKKKFFKYLLTVLIATLFHSTAILMLVLYVVFNMKTSVINVVILVIVSILLTYSYEWIYSLVENITDKDVNLDYEYYVTQVNVFRVAVACAPCVFLVLLSRKARLENSMLCNMIIINAALMCITSSSAFLARIAMYSTAFIPIAITNLKNKIKFDKGTKFSVEVIILILYFVFFIISILNTANLYPYRAFFQYGV